LRTIPATFPWQKIFLFPRIVLATLGEKFQPCVENHSQEVGKSGGSEKRKQHDYEQY
jgi:hypothetical protein